MTKNTDSAKSPYSQGNDYYQDFILAFKGSGQLLETSNVVINERELIEKAYQAKIAYNPLNRYFEPQESAHELLNKLKNELLNSTYMPHKLLLSHIEDIISYNDLMARHDPQEITQYSLKKFGPLTNSTLLSAWKILSQEVQPSPEPERVLDSLQVKRLIEIIVGKFFSSKWRVEVKTGMHAKLSISPARSTINLRSNLVMSGTEFLRLVVHELGVHVLRTFNGLIQSSPLWAIGMGPDHLLTEEGLAVWVEEELGLLDLTTKRKYALRVIAIDLAPKSSFFEIYSLLRKFVDSENSFDIANRVKRGFSDTSAQGFYSKDKVYLEGYHLVDAYLKVNKDMLPILLSGKISLSQLTLPEFNLNEITPYEKGIKGIGEILSFARELLDELA